MISAFGVEHGELSKADRKQKALYGAAGAGGATAAAGGGTAAWALRRVKSGKTKGLGEGLAHIGAAGRAANIGAAGAGVAGVAGGAALYRHHRKNKS